MNTYVKTLIKRYKDPSIIGERSIEEVISYLKQKFVIKDKNISNDQMKICIFNIVHSIDGENILSQNIKLHTYSVEYSDNSKIYYEELDDDMEIYVYIDEYSGYIESNSSRLFTELELYKGISQYDYDNNTDKLIEYLTHFKDLEETL